MEIRQVLSCPPLPSPFVPDGQTLNREREPARACRLPLVASLHTRPCRSPTRQNCWDPRHLVAQSHPSQLSTPAFRGNRRKLFPHSHRGPRNQTQKRCTGDPAAPKRASVTRPCLIHSRGTE